MDKLIYGGDTETCRGKPMTLQFYSEDVACSDIYWVNEKNAADVTIKWCSQRRRNVQHVVYVHNLGFDLPEFFWGYHQQLIAPDGIDFHIGHWHITGVYGTPTFCRVSNGHDITVLFIDSYSFFRESLGNWAAKNLAHLPKLPRPNHLGEKKFTRRDAKFVDYAMRDAEIDYHMGRQIERLHSEFDLQQCLSVADMSARIFKHKYLSYTIPQPGRDVIEASLLSYHGGKNNITVESGWYENVTSLDIKSAYPKALHDFPAFSNEKLYKRYKGGRVKSVPDFGVYCISGVVASCSWPVIFSHGFKPLAGEINQVWVQGYEVNEALRSGEFKAQKIVGTYYDADRDHQAPAFRFFIEDIFARKEAATDPVMREMYKLIANSASGKLIQTRKRGTQAFTDIDAEVTVNASELIAGGLFHPFIASATTAHTRAHIHRLEHQHKALHTATDGIMSQSRKAKSVGRGLGAVTLEAKGATLMLLRNKTYILYGDDPTSKSFPSKHFKGKQILKYALHGFQGSVHELERLVATNTRKYTVNRPNRLKESLKRGLTPNDFVKRQMLLRVPPLRVRSSEALE